MQTIILRLLVATLVMVNADNGVFHQSTGVGFPAETSRPRVVRGQSCYEFNEEEKTWMEAYEYCHERNGRLVTITDADLQDWLTSVADPLWPNTTSIWLGLNKISEGEFFSWDSYSTKAEHSVLYTNWENGYPINDSIYGKCAVMRRHLHWRWTTDSCWGPFSFRCSYICEYRAINVFGSTIALSNRTGIVDVNVRSSAESFTTLKSATNAVGSTVALLNRPGTPDANVNSSADSLTTRKSNTSSNFHSLNNSSLSSTGDSVVPHAGLLVFGAVLQGLLSRGLGNRRFNIKTMCDWHHIGDPYAD